MSRCRNDAFEACSPKIVTSADTGLRELFCARWCWFNASGAKAFVVRNVVDLVTDKAMFSDQQAFFSIKIRVDEARWKILSVNGQLAGFFCFGEASFFCIELPAFKIGRAHV